MSYYYAREENTHGLANAATTSSGIAVVPSEADLVDSPNALRSHVIEISGGLDIVDQSVTQTIYIRLRGLGVCILSGSTRAVTYCLHPPAAAPLRSGSVTTLHRRFEILSLSAMVLPPTAPPGAGGLTIFMAGGRG